MTLFAAVLIVIGQCSAAFAASAGAHKPSCQSSDQCNDGLFCGVKPENIGGRGRCYYCGDSVPLSIQYDSTGAILNDPRQPGHPTGFNVTLVGEVCTLPAAVTVHGLTSRGDPRSWDWSAERVASWCEACVSAVDGHVDPLTQTQFARASVNSMGPFGT